MAEQVMKIVAKDGAFHVSGVLNEYADFGPLLEQPEPLQLNMRQVTRLNSIGVRNLLKFLADWGPKAFSYDQCPSKFIDQINMIPALLGVKNHGTVKSLFVPYECNNCDHEEEVLAPVDDYCAFAKGQQAPKRQCPKCASPMNVLTDSFFVFLNH